MRKIFDQVGFDWSQRGQFGVLFPMDMDVEKLEAKILAKALKNEAIDSVSQAVGYLRPRDDGDFAEVGFEQESERQRWVRKLIDVCTRAQISV